jgi:hypothetical protein
MVCGPSSCDPNVDAAAENITSANYSIASGTQFQITFAKTHTQPYKIRQQGSTFWQGFGVLLHADPTSGFNAFTFYDSGVNPLWRMPLSASSSFPTGGYSGQYVQPVTGGNGANHDLVIRHNKPASVFKITDATAGATVLFKVDNSGITTWGNATNTPLMIDASAGSAAVIKCGGTKPGCLLVSSQGGAGSKGTFNFYDNLIDFNQIFSVNANSSQVQIAGTKTTFSTSTGIAATYNNLPKDAHHDGLPFITQSATQTAQAANIGATNLIASATAGRYRMSCYVAVTRQATTSATVPTCNMVCTDPADSVAKTIQITPAIERAGSNPGTSVGVSGSGICDAKASTAIQYSTTNYTSVGGTAMQYKIYVVLETM